ncbi:MAG: CoA transferase [Burkholderiaceae bacterium]|nr:CoA transferase [Burkholderiaceae bacterium]
MVARPADAQSLRPGARPLAGVRVLDLTNVLAGPFCGHQLAHLGADVIKVETPDGGDLARQLGADPDLNRLLMGVSFLAQNAGKRSLTLNLKHPQGKQVFRRLVGGADVVLENFRPGVMARLGLDFEALKLQNPRLVYCAISGFGQDGPMRDLPAYDQIVQGLSGLMSITGARETAPYRVGYPVADTVGGLTAAMAICAALAARDPSGQRPAALIDVSMLESVIATMGWVVSNFLIAGKVPGPLGNDNFTASPSGTFRTGNGPLNIAANKQSQFVAACEVLGVPGLADDPRFASREARLANRDALKTEFERVLAGDAAQSWAAKLNAAGVPAGSVLSVPDALGQAQVLARELIETFDDVPGVDRQVRIARPGVRIDGAPLSVTSPPPRLGEHGRALLREVGYADDAIDALANEGVI